MINKCFIFIFLLQQTLCAYCKSPVSKTAKKTLPELTAHEYQINLTGLSELSGLCLSYNKDFLWGVDDSGALYRINIYDYEAGLEDGFFTLEWDKKGEMEDIAIDSENGNLYIALESPEKSAFMIPYNNGYDFNRNFIELFKIEDVALYKNKGIEGLTLYKNDLYFGAQKDALLYRYTKNGRLKNKKSLKNIDGCDIKEIAGLDYDAENDWLWVLDSKTFKIYLFNGKADKLLAEYSIIDTANNNPEGICVDKEHNCIWICEDIKKTSILHKYSLLNCGIFRGAVLKRSL